MRCSCVLLLAGLFGLSHARNVPADEGEDKAVKAVEGLKGKANRSANLPGKPVVSVMLTGNKVADDDLKHVAAFKDLISLNLSSSAVTGDGFKHLAPLTKMGTIELMSTKVTDENLKHLSEMKSLH